MISLPALRPSLKAGNNADPALCRDCDGTGFTLTPDGEALTCSACDGRCRVCHAERPLPFYAATCGDELLEVGNEVGGFVREVVARWAGSDVAVWLREGDEWEPTWRLVGLVRPGPGGAPAVTYF